MPADLPGIPKFASATRIFVHVLNKNFQIIFCIAFSIQALLYLPRAVGNDAYEEQTKNLFQDWGTPGTMVTERLSREKLLGLREAEFSKMSFDDPRLQSAYIDVFWQNIPGRVDYPNQMPIEDEYLRSALNDMRARGDSVRPLLMELMTKNQGTRIESDILIYVDYLKDVKLEPFVDYAREVLKTRWKTMVPDTQGAVCSLLIKYGNAKDIENIRDLAVKRPRFAAHIAQQLRRAKPAAAIEDSPQTNPSPKVGNESKVVTPESSSDRPYYKIICLVLVALGASYFILRTLSRRPKV
jgi:hypothetical protein